MRKIAMNTLESKLRAAGLLAEHDAKIAAVEAEQARKAHAKALAAAKYERDKAIMALLAARRQHKAGAKIAAEYLTDQIDAVRALSTKAGS